MGTKADKICANKCLHKTRKPS